jgi:hypothetical protein
MSDRLLNAIVSRLSPENRAGFLAEIERQEERSRNLEPYLRQIRECPSRAEVAAVLLQLRRAAFFVQWSEVNAAIRERWSASSARWAQVRAAKLDRAAVIAWFCPNCGKDRHPIWNGGEVAGCIVCGAEMVPRKKEEGRP